MYNPKLQQDEMRILRGSYNIVHSESINTLITK